MYKMTLFFVLILGLGISGVSRKDATSADQKLPIPTSPDAPQNIQYPPIPADLTFAGQKVPMDDPDIRERLERELLSNTFYHSKTLQVLKLSTRWKAPITKIMEEEGLPSDFFYLAVAESALDNNAISSAKAIGMWQFMASVGKSYGLEISTYVDQRRDPYLATRAAAAYLKEMKGVFGNWVNAAASYNRGKTGMSNALRDQKVDSYFDLYLNPESVLLYSLHPHRGK